MNNLLSDSQKPSDNGSALHKLSRILQKSALTATAALTLSGCDDKKVELGPTLSHKDAIERPVYTEKTAKIDYITDNGNPLSPEIKNIEITLPRGNYRVSILGLRLSGDDGKDSIKGAEPIFSQMYNSTGEEGPIPIKVNNFGAKRSLMIISGNNLQQTVLFNAEKVIVYPDSTSTSSSQNP